LECRRRRDGVAADRAPSVPVGPLLDREQHEGRNRMIGYVTLGTQDIARSASFYDALLATIGASRSMTSDRFVAWAVSPSKPALAVALPYDGNAANVGNGTM